jgi:myo-inositol 2-dehydrogenase/D-chiro-inositol 1-dehydrogenase
MGRSTLVGVEPLRVGVVGTGWIARDHLRALARLDGVRVVAVCDLDEGRAARAAADAGASAYLSWEELFERERLDAVWVCTPPLAHRDPAVAALEHGFHLFLEKPIARTLDDALAVVAAAEQRGVVCAVGYQWHGLELLDDVRVELASQAIGLLVGTSIGPTQSRPWFLDRAQGGGQVLERASHHVDLQRAIAGDVLRVQAAAVDTGLGLRDGGDIDDAVLLVLHFAGGALGSVHVAWTREGLDARFALELVAAEATLQIALDPDFALSGTSRGRRVESAAQQHPFQRTIGRFVEAVRAGDPEAVFCTPTDAAGTLAVVLACEDALTSGETVIVPQLVRP